MNKKVNKAFTLVELIVVITILAILGTIAFLSFQGYNKDSRDAVRTTDIGNIKTSLEVFNTKVGSYPLPSNYTGITYSGGVVRNQGIFGEDPFKQLGDISKLPQDPLGNIYYTYSVTNSKGEYEIAVVYEGNISKKDKDITTKTYADGTLQGVIKVDGTYNGVYVMTNTGGINYTVFTPTIINGDMNVLDLPSIISGGKAVINGGKTLPDSYNNSNFKNEVTNIGIGTNILISTGSIADLKAKNNSGTILRLEFLDNLQTILSGSTIENSYKDIINNPTNDTLALNIIDGKYKPNVVTSGLVASNPGGGGGGGGGGGCTLSAVLGSNTISNCSTQGEILSANSSYCSCDSPDIIVCTGVGAGHVLSACNVGTDISGTGSSSYGNYFQFGRNKGFTSSSPIHYSRIPADVNTTGDTYDFVVESGEWNWTTTGSPDNNWGGVDNDTNLIKGPCIAGYHVSTISEWNSVKDSMYTFYTSSDGILFRDLLLMPFSGYRSSYDNGLLVDNDTIGNYWTREQYSNPDESYRFWIDNGNSSNNATTNMANGLSVRCFKD